MFASQTKVLNLHQLRNKRLGRKRRDRIASSARLFAHRAMFMINWYRGRTFMCLRRELGCV